MWTQGFCSWNKEQKGNKKKSTQTTAVETKLAWVLFLSITLYISRLFSLQFLQILVVVNKKVDAVIKTLHIHY